MIDQTMCTNIVGIWCGNDKNVEDANFTLFSENGEYKFTLSRIETTFRYTYLKGIAYLYNSTASLNNSTASPGNNRRYLQNNMSYLESGAELVLNDTFYMW